MPDTSGRETPRLRQSLAHILLEQSPAHALAAMRKPSAPSDAMERGTIIDRLLLGDPKGEIAVVDPLDYLSQPKKKGDVGTPPKGWTNDAIRAARDLIKSERRVPVLKADFDEYEETATVLREKLLAKGVDLEGSQKHVLVKWTSPDHVECSGEIDLLNLYDEEAIIDDIKSCEDASDETIVKALVNHGNDIQHAAYIEAIECLYPHLTGRVKFRFFFCEMGTVLRVRRVFLSGTMRALGSWKWSKAKKIWSECIRTGIWSANDDDLVADAKPWQLTGLMEAGEAMTFEGA